MSDYIANSTDLIFAHCSSEQCLDITIIDDNTLEQRETFTVILERSSSLDERIGLVNGEKTVTIIDDDDDGK